LSGSKQMQLGWPEVIRKGNKPYATGRPCSSDRKGRKNGEQPGEARMAREDKEISLGKPYDVN